MVLVWHRGSFSVFTQSLCLLFIEPHGLRRVQAASCSAAYNMLGLVQVRRDQLFEALCSKDCPDSRNSQAALQLVLDSKSRKVAVTLPEFSFCFSKNVLYSELEPISQRNGPRHLRLMAGWG